jgi:YD repeat-containing protein
MKIIQLFTLSLLLLVCVKATAQQQVSYVYDLNGNRVSRTIVLKKVAEPEADSTESTFNDYMLKTAWHDLQRTDMLGETLLNIYPNPTTGQIFIETSHTGDRDTRFALYGSNGEKISEGSMSGAGKSQVDLSLLPSGIYFLWFTDADHSLKWKVIKK